MDGVRSVPLWERNCTAVSTPLRVINLRCTLRTLGRAESPQRKRRYTLGPATKFFDVKMPIQSAVSLAAAGGVLQLTGCPVFQAALKGGLPAVSALGLAGYSRLLVQAGARELQSLSRPLATR